MASSSPGSDWSSILQKRCLARRAENETQSNLLDVAKCVEKTENSFSANDENDFNPTLSILLADFFVRNASQRNLTFGGIISTSCKIIMPSLLGALQKSSNDLLAQNPSLQAVQPSHVLLALKALSTGALEMNDTDFELLESYLKDLEKSKNTECLVSETVKKNRPDLNAALLDQFVSVIPGAMFEKAMTQLISEGEAATFTRKDSTTQNLSTVCRHNIANLCSLDVADTIVNFCQSLPNVASFIEKWNGAMEGLGLGLPSSLSEAQLIKQNITNLKEDMLLAKKALNLPLLEPLTKERLRLLTKIGMGCLLAAISVATSHSIFAAASSVPTKSVGSSNPNMAPSKQSASPNAAAAVCNREEEWESNAVTVVETAVEIYSIEFRPIPLPLMTRSFSSNNY